MKKSTNDKKDALKSTKKTNPKKTKLKSNSKNKTYKYGRYDALNNGKCPNCGKAINRKAIRCIHCNYNFIENKVMPKTKGFEKVSGTSKIIEHDNYIGGYPKRHNSKPKKNVSSLYFHTISDIPKTTIENSSDKSKSKKCPNCGKLIKKSATKCIYCDYDLKVKRMENKPSYELVVDNNHDEKKYCQKCGRANPKDVKFCGWCGSKFGEIPNYCPNCDRLFNNQEMFCTECGSNLVNKSIYKRNTQKDKPKVKTKPKIIPKYNNVESKSGKDYKVKLDIKNQKTVDVDYGSENIYKNINPIDLELELEMATNKYHDCLKSGDMFMANYYKQKIDEIKRVLRF